MCPLFTKVSQVLKMRMESSPVSIAGAAWALLRMRPWKCSKYFPGDRTVVSGVGREARRRLLGPPDSMETVWSTPHPHLRLYGGCPRPPGPAQSILIPGTLETIHSVLCYPGPPWNHQGWCPDHPSAALDLESQTESSRLGGAGRAEGRGQPGGHGSDCSLSPVQAHFGEGDMTLMSLGDILSSLMYAVTLLLRYTFYC